MKRLESNAHFIGLLNDKNTIEQIVKNFKNTKSSNVNAKLGIFVGEDIRCYADYVNSQKLERSYKNVEKSYNAPLKSIVEIGVVKLPDKEHKFEKMLAPYIYLKVVIQML